LISAPARGLSPRAARDSRSPRPAGWAPRISVIVPAYNEEELLSDCLDALLAQDYWGEIEIIVVDNASTDATGEIARGRGVRVVEEPRRGYGRALRRGFAAGTGEILACTDADTVVPRDWARRLVESYAADDSVVCAGGDVEFTDPNLRGWLFTRLLLPLLVYGDRLGGSAPHLWGASFSVRQEVFVRAGGFHPDFDLQVDTELSERLREYGRVVLVSGVDVRTSCRRWNHSLVWSGFLFGSNFLWLRLFHKPLWHFFPNVREAAWGAGKNPALWWRRRYAPALAAVVLFVVGLAGYDAFAPWSNAFGKTYWYGPHKDKVVALTFDDGPEEPYTSEVLAILEREHVRATFFVIGANVRRYPDAAARIVAEGHAIGNHSDTHPITPPLALDPETVIRAEVDRAEREIHDVAGVYPSIFRPPQGIRSPWLMKVTEQDSLATVTWDDAARDWERRSADDLVARAVKETKPGAIILLHDGLNLDHQANRTATVEALPRIIEELRAKGYRFVTVPELLHLPPALTNWRGGSSNTRT
jgi:peptidoglycan/xylan/chitin deacetylase (PgdA/CDA1 family)